MHLKLIVILLLTFSTLAFSQKKAEKGFIKANYECTYSVNYINDTIKMTRGTKDWFILKIGDNFSYGYSYLCFQLDSFFRNMTKESAELMMGSMKNGTWSNRYSGDLMYAKIYKDFNAKKLFVIDNISTNYFIYEEYLIPQNWTILNDTMTVAGYICQKAICDYRGRSYEAWFAPEIPISEGPWKFFGLPGLIMKVYDTEHHYEFELDGLIKSEEKIDIQPLIEKKISIFGKQTILTKIERKKFFEVKFGEKGNMVIGSDMSQIGLNYEPVLKKYGYIELDYK